MAASDWEEIKRLAADFQKAQLSSTAHKLSDRNCIEIVNKLISLGLTEVVHTTDGKEYLTPQQIEREIRDELIVHGGRINLVDLQQIINVDLTHIENRVTDIIRGDRHFFLIHGELIDKDYRDRTAEEINETLQEAGQVLVADLAKTFNLPNDFVLSIIEDHLGVTIHGQLDSINKDVLFTAAFIARNRARIRGIFTAITKPTQLIQLVAQYGLPEKLFFSVLESLVSNKRLSGAIQGHQEKAVYIPESYSKSQTSFIDAFLKQNGYMEYSTLAKIGISDARQFLKKRFSEKEFLQLSSCCVSSVVIDQVDAAIDEALTNESWVDIMPLVPSPLTEADMNLLLQHCCKGTTRSSAHIFCDQIVASDKFIAKCKKSFQPLMQQKAEKDVKTSPTLFADLTRKEKMNLTETDTGEGKQARKDERNKKANQGGGTKGGGGRGARESNTKKVKNKYRDRMKADEEEASNASASQKKGAAGELPFMSLEEIESTLRNNITDCDDDQFIEELAKSIIRPLTKEFQEVAKSVFLSSTGESAATKRKSHQELQDKVNGLYSNMKLFEKGIGNFEGDTEVQLCKHLLKTIGSDIVNIIFGMVANENLMSLAEGDIFDSQTRLKLLNKLPDNIRSPMTKLNNAVNGKDLADFFDQLDVMCSPSQCDLLLKKLDKKKERNLLFNHRAALLDQLERDVEPAMTLHLAATILFQHYSGNILHAPGRCIPQVITYLSQHVSEADYTTLVEYQGLVVKQLSKKDETVEPGESSTGSLLAERLDDIKKIVRNLKKNVSNVE